MAITITDLPTELLYQVFDGRLSNLLTVILVSKHFRDIGCTILYRALKFSSYENALKCFDTIIGLASALEGSTTPIPQGHYVTSLHIDGGPLNIHLAHRMRTVICQALPHMPNLRTFRCMSPSQKFPIYPDVFIALFANPALESAAISLPSVHVVHGLPEEEKDLLEAFIPTSVHIRELRIAIPINDEAIHCSYVEALRRLLTITASRLHTLKFFGSAEVKGDLLSLCSPSDLPSATIFPNLRFLLTSRTSLIFTTSEEHRNKLFPNIQCLALEHIPRPQWDWSHKPIQPIPAGVFPQLRTFCGVPEDLENILQDDRPALRSLYLGFAPTDGPFYEEDPDSPFTVRWVQWNVICDAFRKLRRNPPVAIKNLHIVLGIANLHDFNDIAFAFGKLEKLMLKIGGLDKNTVRLALLYHLRLHFEDN